jgi:low affinity Fe/Cu permease
MSDWFRRFAIWSADMMGSPWMFVANVVLILVWFVSGPLFRFSDTWQLVVNTATTVFTYLAVFLIQNTQNRDAKAIHLKLDELIRCVDGARNGLVNLQELTDEELEQLQAEFTKLRERTARNGEGTECIEELKEDVEEELDKREEIHEIARAA